MSRPPALLVTKDAVKSDFALAAGARGARKLLVTEIFATKECEATEVEWQPPKNGGKCPVQTMPDTEVAVFNQHASQDRHKHKEGTEIYMVLEGTMIIDVEGTDHELSAGDAIVVNPHACHEVKPNNTEFLCRVVTVRCRGASDKFEC